MTKKIVLDPQDVLDYLAGPPKRERGVLEIRNGCYVDIGTPAHNKNGDGFYWFEVAPGEKITEGYGPFASLAAAQEAAATQPSLRQTETVLETLEQEGLIVSFIVDGEKRWWVRMGD
jgi:hypothetical protein